MWLKTSQIIANNHFPLMTKKCTPVKMFKKFLASSNEADNIPSFNFTDQENNQILEIMNSTSIDNLAKYDISKAKLNKVEAWKQKNGGKFQSINDILQVDSFSLKIAEKFYKSLLGTEPVMKPARKAAPFVTPNLHNQQINEINSSVSINVGVSSITWSRLVLNKDGPCDLTHWQRHDIKDKRLHLHDLIDRCLYVNFVIPQADCYVFENPQVAQSGTPGNADQVNINVQRAQLIAILSYALSTRNKPTERSKPNVFYLKRFLAARLFQQLIGTERVSAEKAILNLMRNYYDIDYMIDNENEKETITESPSSRGNVYFPTELQDMYKDAERYNREFLGQALLLNLAFVRLVLLQDPEAMSSVVRNAKSNPIDAQ
ncbi:uncharacterized protein LOC129939147 [Eupeodes corollae]|uniref:uncharacterized protein LOC129939147 n=1 Tax=Eupeodes corollae TaxID=290404 RepID=UPI002492614A|nr:uncharacterized protein LOC129939147 [Eupeodes corollae]